MSILQKTRIVSSPKAHVWNILKDFGGVHQWHLKVERSPLHTNMNEGLGATRTCHFYDGSSVVEEIIEYEEGKLLKVELRDFSMPLKGATAQISLESVGPNKTEVTFKMEYKVKFGPMGWAMNKAMIQPMMGKMFTQVLEGLDHHAQTGELIGSNGKGLPAPAMG